MTKLQIVYEDDAVVAVNKPAGLATIPGRAEETSVLEQLGQQLGLPVRGEIDPRVRVVHRLDKDTSGVLLFAKTIEAQRYLSHQFQNNTAQKQYVALVIGRPPTPEGEVDAPIAPDKQHVGAMKIDKRGKPARTAWRVVETFRDITLLYAMPKTGKTHQIRVHLQQIGHPLAVDPLYGPTADDKGPGVFLSRIKRGYRLGKYQEERPLISRLTLHAEKLQITLPTGALVEIAAELPRDMATTLKMLRKYGQS